MLDHKPLNYLTPVWVLSCRYQGQWGIDASTTEWQNPRKSCHISDSNFGCSR